MKKIILLLSIICVLISGCGVELSESEVKTDVQLSKDFYNSSATYFDHYTSEINHNTCKIQGAIHQMASDKNGILIHVAAQDDFGSITIRGSMDCIKGAAKLVYTSPNGTETLIADDPGGKIDTQIAVAEGEGTVNFVGKGKNAVCEFDLEIEAGDSVMFAGTEDVLESVKDGLESIEDNLEDVGIDEIEDNWPEYIRYSGDGVYADPLIVTIEIDKPMTLSLTCVTVDGRLRLKIADHDRKNIYFDETNPNGTYAVDIPSQGTYQLLIYAKYHVGSIEVTPVEE